jgi:hypothetical protein
LLRLESDCVYAQLEFAFRFPLSQLTEERCYADSLKMS